MRGLRIKASLCPCLAVRGNYVASALRAHSPNRRGGTRKSELGGHAWRWQRRPPPPPDRGDVGGVGSGRPSLDVPPEPEARPRRRDSALLCCCEGSGIMKRLAI